MDILRRNFLKAASGLGAGLAASEVLLKPVLAGNESIQAQSPVTTTPLSTPETTKSGEMLYRTLVELTH